MSDVQNISPLLDGFALGNPISEHDGIRCCPAIKEASDKKYIVKIISIPASQVQLDALLLAGAYRDPEDAMAYFKQIGQDIMEEAQFLKELSQLDGFLSYDGWQMEPIQKKRLGYEVYLTNAYRRTLEKYVRKQPVTHLEAINLGLDMCSALSVCRQAGAMYIALKPSNIFVSEKKEYRIGDLGFVRLDAMKYTALPKKYCSSYTPPELLDPMASLNLSVDTYALGVILYQLYNEGSFPIRSESQEEAIPNPVHADYELSEIIMKAIHPDPEKRWLDPSDMGHALASYMQRNSVNDVPITPYTPIDVEAQDVQIPRDEPVAEAAPAETPSEVSTEVQELAAPVEAPVDNLSDVQCEPEVIIEDIPEAENIESEIAESIKEVFEETAASNEATVPDLIPEPITEIVQDTIEEVNVEEPTSSQVPDNEVSFASSEFTRIFEKADDLISHETPVGVVLPEIPDQPDPFAFAWEDSIEAEDLSVPFDPVMETQEESPSRKEKRAAKKFRSQERKRKLKKFFGTLLVFLILAGIAAGGFWFYQNFYLQTIHSMTVESARDQLTVNISTDADESALLVTCSDNYGNTLTQNVTSGQATFSGLLPNTMYKVEVSIDGFHKLVGQTSELFTTEASTSILTFTSAAGAEDGTVVLNFTVDGEEPKKWTIEYGTNGEETRKQTFTDHSITIDGLTVGKVYVFTLSAGEDISLSGNTILEVMSSRLILAENLTATTTNGTDMTIRWTTPGDTVVESWNVRCYNDSGYDETLTVTDTEVYLTGIDSSVSYNVEVTAYGMTKPARTSITANPLNITALNVDASQVDKLNVSWEFAGAKPKGGWLLMYNIDGNSDLNVIKCDDASAVIAPKIPDADYQFTIQSVDGTSIFGNVHSYTCPSAEALHFNGLSAENIEMNTVNTPDEKDWHFDNIGSKGYTDQFVVGDGISLILYATTDFYTPGDHVKIQYVLRDAYGNVMPDYVSEEDTYWKNIWLGGNYHYAELDIPSIPEVAGTYTVSLYFNGMSVGETTFTISK